MYIVYIIQYMYTTDKIIFFFWFMYTTQKYKNITMVIFKKKHWFEVQTQDTHINYNFFFFLIEPLGVLIKISVYYLIFILVNCVLQFSLPHYIIQHNI